MTDLCCGCSSFYRVLLLNSFLAFLLVIHLTLELRLIQTIDYRIFPFLNIHWSLPSGKRIDRGLIVTTHPSSPVVFVSYNLTSAILGGSLTFLSL